MQAAFGVYVDFCNAERNCLFNLVGGNTRAAVKNEGHIANLFFNCRQRLEGKSGPVCGVFAVNVAYACGGAS